MIERRPVKYSAHVLGVQSSAIGRTGPARWVCPHLHQLKAGVLACHEGIQEFHQDIQDVLVQGKAACGIEFICCCLSEAFVDDTFPEAFFAGPAKASSAPLQQGKAQSRRRGKQAQLSAFRHVIVLHTASS